jgi:hypothetical protein
MSDTTTPATRRRPTVTLAAWVGDDGILHLSSSQLHIHVARGSAGDRKLRDWLDAGAPQAATPGLKK